MMDNILKTWVDEIQKHPIEPVTYTFFVKPKGNRAYHIEELSHRVGITPPAEYEFTANNGDRIVIWSLNPFLSRKEAHELAIQMGEKLGVYV